MKSIVIYSSLTGNTKQVAEAITSVLPAGVPPQMAHAKESLINAANCLPDGVETVGTFICQGKVDPKVIEMMYKMFPKGHSHGQSADRDARHKQAAVHPNEDDFKAAQDFAKDILIKLS